MTVTCNVTEVAWDRYKQGLVKDAVIRSKLNRDIATDSDVPKAIKIENMRPLGNTGYSDMTIYNTNFVSFKPNATLTSFHTV